MTKTWFITGTSSGFGKELTELALARGDKVAATIRRPNALDALKEVYPDALEVLSLDVVDTNQIRRVFQIAHERLGQIDNVVSNAGYGLFGGAEEVSDDEIDLQLRTNLTGSIQVARAALPFLRAQGRGHLIQISSVGGQVAFPLLSIYHASKWGIEGFYESLHQEVASFGIKVTIVEPGGARTPWGAGNAHFAEPMNVYENTIVGGFRKMVTASGAANSKGDPVKIAQAIINVTDQENPPLRLALGSDAFGAITAALTSRLEALETQKEIALSTDIEAVS
jgi:NAD(P)-dependent dehydrogenase (short-subunit alcohol dehydrogenase family)